MAIVEDHLLQRKRTEELVGSQAGLRVVHGSETMPEFLAWLKTAERAGWPHLLILDLMADRQPSVDPAVVKGLVEAGLRIVVLSALVSPALVREIVRAGVGGIVGKRDSEDDIVTAIWAVLNHGEWMTTELAGVIASDPTRPPLSVQEERALVLYASGLTLDAVATSIGVKRDTAKQYIDRVKAKYTAAGRPVSTKLDLHRIAVADGYTETAYSAT
ncbi:response regulator [Herbiconiux ginsengi]|uniref:DNA-binding response regulator, NarL/FixJ family, contains REC and HTH domains n=1 Tax=Herbiconiux ginsengi TaxID=381665 RepID=A0A1H3U3I0_9MICO|nr:response regulator [Herbiconiux ginsengi]SDZ57026.1 DNA-binding response regulator, NarL/FixJ family, contains REC and HTH domains [Herbiconiux ginsengi]